ncbi:MAG TPA: hypothetical protein VGI35_08780 [Steroidobacteraceae bacterium]
MTLPIARAAIATANTYSVAATTNDPSGVTWSVAAAAGTPPANAGTFNPATTANGAAVTYTPKGPGTFTVTATSITNTTVSTAFTLYVSDLAGVYTYHNDLNRDGANTQEYALTPQNVQSHFGKLFSCPVDGAIYAQPLWVAGVTINGAKHNVVYVATEHDGLWALDADTSPCQKLWQVSLIDPPHGGNAGETSVPGGPQGSPQGFLVGMGNGDMAPEVGVTGTPVIASGATPGTGTLYVVSKSVSSDGKTFYQRLHAIDITTGAEATGGSFPGKPVTIAGTTAGKGDGGAIDTFVSQVQNQRPGLALVNGTVYVGWSGHEDFSHYYGWIMGYSAATLQQTVVFNDVPNNTSANGFGGGIWMAGGAPAVDAAGNLYLLTGNGLFDANSASAPNNDYGDSLVKLTGANGKLAVADYFTPSDQQDDDTSDTDFGSGGAAILADLPQPVTIGGVAITHLIVGGDEKGRLYLLNRDKLGGFTGSNSGAVQVVTAGAQNNSDNSGVIYATGAYWNGTFYIMADGATAEVQAYQLNASTAQLSLTSKAPGFGFPSGTPSVSAQGATGGVLWTLDDTQFCTPESPGCSPAVLHAYDATNLATELYNSSKVAADAAGFPVKFTLPTVANGKVYVGTRGNNQGLPDNTPGPNNSPAIPGELDVYGLNSN